MSCLCVVDQPIGAHNAQVALRHQRPDELSFRQLLHQPFRVIADCLCDLFERRLVDTGQNAFDSGGISDQDDRAARNRGLRIDGDRSRMARGQLD